MSDLLARAAAAGSAVFLIVAAVGMLTQRAGRTTGNPFVYRPARPSRDAFALAGMLIFGIVTLALLIAGEMK